MFTEHFAFEMPARVNFVGGGGKSSLILRLMEECSETAPVIYTTTTRIHPPHPGDGTIVISSDNEDYLEQMLDRAIFGSCRGRKFVVTHLSDSPNLLPGVNPGFADRLDGVVFPLVLNEADGARSMSLKMPHENEPVLMSNANYLVPVIGLDCLNQPMGPETIFRWELASQRCRLRAGDILTSEIAAGLLLHPRGVCRDWEPGMRIIPFINKADSEEREPLARSLARELLKNGNFPVERVVWGSLQNGKVASIAAGALPGDEQ